MQLNNQTITIFPFNKTFKLIVFLYKNFIKKNINRTKHHQYCSIIESKLIPLKKNFIPKGSNSNKEICLNLFINHCFNSFCTLYTDGSLRIIIDRKRISIIIYPAYISPVRSVCTRSSSAEALPWIL